MSAATLQSLASIPGTTLHADARGIKVVLDSPIGFGAVHALVPLCNPVRVGATAVATGELDGLAVTVTAPVLEAIS